MEINFTGNASVANSIPSEPASGGVENKTGSTEASSVSQQASVDKTNGTVAPPPGPITEVAPEGHTVKPIKSGSENQVNLTA